MNLIIGAVCIYVGGFLCGHVVTKVAYRKRRVAREFFDLALGVAVKHEQLLLRAMPAVHHLAQIAHKAKLENDALKLKTLHNNMRCAIGMAERLKDI